MRKTAVASAVVVTTLAVHAPAQAQLPIAATVTQGDRFYFKVSDQSDPADPSTMSYCTVGYNEVAARQSLTAGHCSLGVTNEVFLDTGAGLTRAGFITTDPRFQDVSDSLGSKFVYDQATISWDSYVRMGNNVYSGDRKAAPTSLNVGEEVCFRGATSHAGTRNYQCAPFIGTTEGALLVATGNNPGDSGGPIWAPSKGLIGTVSVDADVQMKNGDIHGITIGTAHSPSYSAFDEDKYAELIGNFFATAGDYVNRIITKALPEDAPPAPSPNASSSTYGIAFGAIAAVIALIAALAPFASRLTF